MLLLPLSKKPVSKLLKKLKPRHFPSAYKTWLPTSVGRALELSRQAITLEWEEGRRWPGLDGIGAWKEWKVEMSKKGNAEGHWRSRRSSLGEGTCGWGRGLSGRNLLDLTSRAAAGFLQAPHLCSQLSYHLLATRCVGCCLRHPGALGEDSGRVWSDE